MRVVLFGLGTSIADRSRDNAVVVFPGSIDDGLRKFRIERVEHRSDDQPEGGAFLSDQGTGQQVRAIVETLGNGKDFFTGGATDPGCVGIP